MTIKFRLFLFSILLAVVSCQNKDKKQALDIQITHQNKGFGYSIYKSKKLYIQQEYIPSVNGFQPFKDRIQAQKTAELVVKKLEKGMLPTLSTKELDSLEILYHQ